MCRRYAESFRERDAVAKGAFPQLRERLVNHWPGVCVSVCVFPYQTLPELFVALLPFLLPLPSLTIKEATISATTA